MFAERIPTGPERPRPVKPAITALRLLAVLNVGFKNVGARHAVPEGAERRAPCTDGLLTHFASPRGEQGGLRLEHRVLSTGNIRQENESGVRLRKTSLVMAPTHRCTSRKK